MPYVPVVLELDYVNTGNLSVPANDELETQYDAPDGWAIVSWGYTAAPEYFRIRAAVIQSPGPGQSQFVGVMENVDSVSHSFRWTFVLIKM